MRIVDTSKSDPTQFRTQTEKDWIYNGLDCCVTAEVLACILPQLDDTTRRTYEFSKRIQGPVLEMRLRGIRIDHAKRAEVIEEYYNKLDFLERNLERIVGDGVGFYGFNWRSNDDLKELFYDRLGIPVIKKGGRPTTNRDALEKMEAYTVARPIVAHMKVMRDLGKKISVLKTAVDKDGRMRTSYNIAGTETGRFSSSLSEFGTGGNMQNIEDLLRQIYIADEGMKMAYLDAEQIQSRIVGAIEWNELKDGKYLDACESGDLHTAVAKICWPKMEWTGELHLDKELAEKPYYRHYSRRFMCKKLGHGTNFNGKPPHMAAQTKIDVSTIFDFQNKYFIAFPHMLWHEWTRRQLRSTGQLTSITGRRRQFWGRRDSEDTLGEALAYSPQADEAFIVNNGMLQVWLADICQLLMQNHDAIVVQFPEEMEDELIPEIKKLLLHPVTLREGRILTIPYGCKTGWNWGEYSEKNPDGLKDYKPGDKRKRTPQVHILDRVVR